MLRAILGIVRKIIKIECCPEKYLGDVANPNRWIFNEMQISTLEPNDSVIAYKVI